MREGMDLGAFEAELVAVVVAALQPASVAFGSATTCPIGRERV
jgi:hypothetical protein